MGEPVRETIFKALRKYKLTNMVEDDGLDAGYPLVDLMSNDGTEITTGEAEMRVLADHIGEALDSAGTHPSSDRIGWLPIDGAPRDGTEVDLWMSDQRWTGFSWDNGWKRKEGYPTFTRRLTASPTHYMLAPGAPA